MPYLRQLHEFPNLCHPGQEPLVDLQGLLTVTLLHLEVFLYENKQVCRFAFIAIHDFIFEVRKQEVLMDHTDLIG